MEQPAQVMDDKIKENNITNLNESVRCFSQPNHALVPPMISPPIREFLSHSSGYTEGTSYPSYLSAPYPVNLRSEPSTINTLAKEPAPVLLAKVENSVETMTPREIPIQVPAPVQEIPSPAPVQIKTRVIVHRLLFFEREVILFVIR
jgi:hypothetical protein